MGGGGVEELSVSVQSGRHHKRQQRRFTLPEITSWVKITRLLVLAVLLAQNK